MCSFDIVSLYTNIPLKEAINTVADKLFPPNSSKGYRVSGFTKELFVKALELCTQDAIFIFNDCLYMQIDGIAMGKVSYIWRLAYQVLTSPFSLIRPFVTHLSLS